MPNTPLGPRPSFSLGPFKASLVEITGPASYVNPGGGVEFTPASLGLTTILAVFMQDSLLGHIARYDPATGKVKFLWTGAGLSAVMAEVTNATNLSTVTVRALVIGT